MVIEDLYNMHVLAWLLLILISYLTKRTMILHYNGEASSPRDLPGSSPQGAFLGIFFFIIKYNAAALRPRIPRLTQLTQPVSCTKRREERRHAPRQHAPETGCPETLCPETLCPGGQYAPGDTMPRDTMPRRHYALVDDMPRRHYAPVDDMPRWTTCPGGRYARLDNMPR